MTPSAVQPFKETIHRQGTAAGAKLLHGQAAGRLDQELAGPAGVISVRGCRDGAGVTFLLESVLEGGHWPVVWVDGGAEDGWSALRAAASSARSAEGVVPALFGRLLAAVVRGGLLPSTDPEVVAMQLEKDSARSLDFAGGTAMTSWLLAQAGTVVPALSRRLSSLGLANGPALVESMMDWARRRADGHATGWLLPGDDAESAVRTLALAAGASGLSLVWAFDELHALGFRPDAARRLWEMVSALTTAGNRIVMAADEETWRDVLEPGLPGAWRARLAARTIRVGPLSPNAIQSLLADRLRSAGVDLPGLPAVIASSSLPMGGTPREGLDAAATLWALLQAKPMEPMPAVPVPQTAAKTPSDAPAAPPRPSLPPRWQEALLSAAASLPFIDAYPLAVADNLAALLWQSPGLWTVLAGPEAVPVSDAVGRTARKFLDKAPPGTRIQITVLAAGPADTDALPPAWNHVALSENEARALATLPTVPDGPDGHRVACLSKLNDLWERLTRPGHAVA